MASRVHWQRFPLPFTQPHWQILYQQPRLLADQSGTLTTSASQGK